tara:strand:+ start:1788 stop:2264 length:477 start_codon:yes stop_codon:yes gene_type:complete
MENKFNSKSEEYLEKFHPNLRDILVEAVTITELDFEILEGPQGTKRQEHLWYKGEINEEGGPAMYGSGVYLGVYIGNIICFSSAIYTELATSISYAASNLGFSIAWGGAYSKWEGLKDITKINYGTLEELVSDCHEEARLGEYDYVPRLNYFELMPEE